MLAKNLVVVVAEVGMVFTDIPATSRCSEIVAILKERTERNCVLYHLGQRLAKNQIVKMEDNEDFILALQVKEEPEHPTIDMSNEQQARKDLKNLGVPILPIEDEKDDGDNPDLIDKIVFHNGRPLKFQYMQQKQPPTEVIDQHTRQFVRNFISSEQHNLQILPLDEREAEVVSRNYQAVLEQLLS